MFNDLDAFSDIKPKKSTVTCANSQEIESTHIGTVNLNFDGKNTLLSDVLYIPKLSRNLLSVTALTKEGNDVHFLHNGTVSVTDNSNSSYEIGHAVGDLFHLTATQGAYLTTEKQDPYVLWHHRFGHPGRHILESISEHVIGISGDLKKSDSKLCEGCTYAKSHRQPFPKSSKNRAVNILERIHSDICGPMPTPSLKGSRYILTFIDDLSRFAHVYFLQQKSDTFKTFVDYRTLVERQTGNPIKILRSDGGGEYINNEMREYLGKHGIHHETTAAHTPEQNGVSERYNRTLVESIRAIMHSAEIPETLWAEIAASSETGYPRQQTKTRNLHTSFVWKETQC